MKGRLYYTNYRHMYTTNTCACVESPHYLAWFVDGEDVFIKKKHELTHGLIIYPLNTMKTSRVFNRF